MSLKYPSGLPIEFGDTVTISANNKLGNGSFFIINGDVTDASKYKDHKPECVTVKKSDTGDIIHPQTIALTLIKRNPPKYRNFNKEPNINDRVSAKIEEPSFNNLRNNIYFSLRYDRVVKEGEIVDNNNLHVNGTVTVKIGADKHYVNLYDLTYITEEENPSTVAESRISNNMPGENPSTVAASKILNSKNDKMRFPPIRRGGGKKTIKRRSKRSTKSRSKKYRRTSKK